MACLQFKPGGAIPTLPAGFTFAPPGLTWPSFDFALCCKIYIPIPLPPIFIDPIAVNPAFLAAINKVIGVVQAYLDQLDAIQVDCPLE